MRIISPFKDYYDSAQAFGQDQTILYVRKQQEIHDADIPRLGGGPFYLPRFPIWNSIIIGFCGQLYTCVVLDCDARPSYSIEDVDKYVDDNYSDENKSQYYDGPKKRSWCMRTYLRRDMVNYLNSFRQRSSCLSKYFEYGPIFVASSVEKTVTINSCLQDYDFARIIDPYSAFQQLAMYMANQARPEKPMPKISDELKAQSKGYDKLSFRKSKTKKT